MKAFYRTLAGFLILVFLLSCPDIFAQMVEIRGFEHNSAYDDFAPALTRNGRMMYFTSERKKGRQKVYSVERSSSGWTTPDDIGSDINNGVQNGAVTLTPDGNYMIFAAYRHGVTGEGRTDLFSARRIDGQWTDVQNLGPAVNSDAWDSQPCISSDGTTLYFVSDRPGGNGGTDIYYSTKTREGWTKAQNAGTAINSSADEMSPIIAWDMRNFSFASNKSGGQGGFDIYIAKVNNNVFSDVKNAGSPINSSADEYFFVTLSNSDVAYFSSNRAGGSGELDIYTAIPNPYKSGSVVMVRGVVRDEKTNKPLGAKIIVTDLKTGQKAAELQSDDQTGDYFVVLQPGRTYSITAESEGYLFYSERYEIANDDKGREVTNDIYLSPTNTRLLIFFDFDKFELKGESIPEIERLIEYLRDYPKVKMLIEGHTDDVGTDQYNDKLSLDRANSVKDYLVSAGLDKNRIKTEGIGKRRPIVKETTDAARAKNRRVEVKIIEK